MPMRHRITELRNQVSRLRSDGLIHIGPTKGVRPDHRECRRFAPMHVLRIRRGVVMAWVLFLGSVGSVVQAQVYKWVDERGVTHYGERTPQGRKGQEVQNKLANPAPGPGAGKAPSWQEQEQD